MRQVGVAHPDGHVRAGGVWGHEEAQVRVESVRFEFELDCKGGGPIALKGRPSPFEAPV